MFGVIDRIEGVIAVLELDNGEIRNVPISSIKGECLEGFVVYLENENYTIDLKETNKRKKEVESFLDAWE